METGDTMSTWQSIWNRIRAAVTRFMQGRYGADQLGLTLISASLALSLLASFTGWTVLSLLGTAGWVWSLWRLLSKNHAARRAENQKYLALYARVKTPLSQAAARFRNRRKYVYFTCPECHMKLRLPRGVGQVTVKCSKCGHSFEKKA